MIATDNVIQFPKSLNTKADRIRALGKQSVANVIEIGELLTECKAEIGHGNFGDWLKHEFDWHQTQATKFMQVYEISKSSNLLNLDWDVSALYLLAAPANADVREKVIKEVIAEAKTTGGRATHQTVKRAIDEVRGKKPKRKTPREKFDAAVQSRQRGKTQTEAAKDAGLKSVQTVKIAEAYEEGWSDCLEELGVDPDTLVLTAKAKLDVAKRMLERKLNAEHVTRMRELDEEVRQRVLKEGKEYLAMMHAREEEATKTISTYREFINNNKPLFTAEQFNTIRMCLHADSEKSRTAAKLHEAFILFNAKKFQLTGEK